MRRPASRRAVTVSPRPWFHWYVRVWVRLACPGCSLPRRQRRRARASQSRGTRAAGRPGASRRRGIARWDGPRGGRGDRRGGRRRPRPKPSVARPAASRASRRRCRRRRTALQGALARHGRRRGRSGRRRRSRGPARTRPRWTGARSPSPVTFAPSRAIEMVSVPMWHCRWARRTPRTLPISATAKATLPAHKVGVGHELIDAVLGVRQMTLHPGRPSWRGWRPGGRST